MMRYHITLNRWRIRAGNKRISFLVPGRGGIFYHMKMCLYMANEIVFQKVSKRFLFQFQEAFLTMDTARPTPQVDTPA